MVVRWCSSEFTTMQKQIVSLLGSQPLQAKFWYEDMKKYREYNLQSKSNT